MKKSHPSAPPARRFARLLPLSPPTPLDRALQALTQDQFRVLMTLLVTRKERMSDHDLAGVAGLSVEDTRAALRGLEAATGLSDLVVVECVAKGAPDA